MKVEQIYTGCSAHVAYYVESKGEAAIFDPLREVPKELKTQESFYATLRAHMKK